ncbi:DUF2255 family protein [Microbacterium gorillae]|uniref:DUF2255 family protein n=1 Tax=Microbacterium gorillae TaxID=1231063 RepID=UPI003D998F56
MAAWDEAALTALDDGDELDIEIGRADGAHYDPVVIWGVRVGTDFYVRSARGPEGLWYRRALRSLAGTLSARGVVQGVTFEQVSASDPVNVDIDAAYHRKYDRYGAAIVGSVVGPNAARVTLRAIPVG